MTKQFSALAASRDDVPFWRVREAVTAHLSTVSADKRRETYHLIAEQALIASGTLTRQIQSKETGKLFVPLTLATEPDQQITSFWQDLSDVMPADDTVRRNLFRLLAEHAFTISRSLR